MYMQVCDLFEIMCIVNNACSMFVLSAYGCDLFVFAYVCISYNAHTVFVQCALVSDCMFMQVCDSCVCE